MILARRVEEHVATKEMGYTRLSHRVKNMAIALMFLEHHYSLNP